MSQPAEFQWFCSISREWQERPCHHVTCPSIHAKFAINDFSSDAIAFRFECGSWTSADVRIAIAAIRTCEQLGEK